MKVSYTLKETFKNLWRNRWMSLASVVSVTATLVILGVIFIFVLNINNISDGAKDQFNNIEIYLKDDFKGEDVSKLKVFIEKLEGVQAVSFKSKDEALEEYKGSWGENAYLLEGFENNPLPNSLIVTLLKVEFSEYVVNKIILEDGIEEVKYDKDFIEKIIKISDYVKHVGLILILILILVSTFIISNTIKLALNSRKAEINIMKYVGATSWFIRWPFVLEGAFLGLIGAILAITIIYISYSYTFELLASFYSLMAAYFVSVDKVLNDSIVLFVTIGAGIGALGSITSIRKYLDV